MALILLICCHFFSGYGVLRLFRVRHKPLIVLPLSMLLGVAVASFLPFVLQLCYCPLYPGTVFGALGAACVLLNLRGITGLRKARGLRHPGAIRRLLSTLRLRIRIYELPYILILSFVMFVSVWRCYYLPPTSRDALSGPEAIAEYTVREHTMINSFFTTDLSTTNNPFKSPFLVCLQVVYKMAGYPFGQVWLCIIFVCFTLLLYQVLKNTLHPILAGLLLLLLTVTPELYAYSFMILYDYSNMVFLFLCLYFLIGYFEDGALSGFYLSALMMGIATYIRSETLVLAVLFIPALWIGLRRMKYSMGKMGWYSLLFLLPAFLSYLLMIPLYINVYLPVHYDIAALVNPHPGDLRPLFLLYRSIFTELLSGEYSIRLWGYFMFVCAGLFLAELIFVRHFTRTARNWLYAIGVIFLGLGLLGFLLPLFDLMNTTKRGLFKILPLMLLYMANNQLLIRLSDRIWRWESARPARPDVVA